MAIDTKSEALARELYQELKLRLGSIATPVTVINQSTDTSNNPLILLGPNPSVAGSQGGTVRVRPIDWPLVTNSVGLPQQVYGPHAIDFVYENIGANTLAFIMNVVMTVAKRGTIVNVYRCAAATAPDYTQFVSGNLQVVYQPATAQGFIGAM